MPESAKLHEVPTEMSKGPEDIPVCDDCGNPTRPAVLVISNLPAGQFYECLDCGGIYDDQGELVGPNEKERLKNEFS